MKHISLISIFCGILFSLNTNGNDFEKTIIKVVKAFKEKDAFTLNCFINRKEGLLVLFRSGIPDEYLKTDIIDFRKPIPTYLPYSDFSTDYKIKYQFLPIFDCGSMKWSKSGLYCDTLNRDFLLSSTAKNLEANKGIKVPDEEIQKFVELENRSRRIVLTDKDGGELIFYLTIIDKKWYLTILDRVSSDCSA